jgi:hypothetical protein
MLPLQNRSHLLTEVDLHVGAWRGIPRQIALLDNFCIQLARTKHQGGVRKGVKIDRQPLGQGFSEGDNKKAHTIAG